MLKFDKKMLSKPFIKSNCDGILKYSTKIGSVSATDSFLGILPFEKPFEHDFLYIDPMGEDNYFQRRLNYSGGIFIHDDQYYVFSVDLTTFSSHYGDKYRVIRIDPKIFELTRNYSPFVLFHYAILFESKFWIINEEKGHWQSNRKDPSFIDIYETDISSIYGGYIMAGNKVGENYTLSDAKNIDNESSMGKKFPKQLIRELRLSSILK